MSRSRTRRKKRELGLVWRQGRVCINCGQPGPHYVPPSLGDAGFFMCKPASGLPGAPKEPE